MFTTPDAHPHETIIFKKGSPKPQEEELIKFLVESKGFNLLKVQNGLKRIKVFILIIYSFLELSKQGRIESYGIFFWQTYHYQINI